MYGKCCEGKVHIFRRADSENECRSLQLQISNKQKSLHEMSILLPHLYEAFPSSLAQCPSLCPSHLSVPHSRSWSPRAMMRTELYAFLSSASFIGLAWRVTLNGSMDLHLRVEGVLKWVCPALHTTGTALVTTSAYQFGSQICPFSPAFLEERRGPCQWKPVLPL